MALAILTLRATVGTATVELVPKIVWQSPDTAVVRHLYQHIHTSLHCIRTRCKMRWRHSMSGQHPFSLADVYVTRRVPILGMSLGHDTGSSQPGTC